MAETTSQDQIRRFLETVTYPINKRTLTETARQQGEDDALLRVIERLPDETWPDHSGLHADLDVAARSNG